jgi:hypothetical protein
MGLPRRSAPCNDEGIKNFFLLFVSSRAQRGNLILVSLRVKRGNLVSELETFFIQKC